MNKNDEFYFELLKKAVSATFLKEHNASRSIQEWKGEDIILFQEDLFNKVKAKVSEKWFYTYFKNETSKLPRIDMLNLLSEYVGTKNWNGFKASHKDTIPSKNKNPYLKYALLTVFSLLFLAWFVSNTKNQFHFCFVDDLQNEAIVKIPLDIKILNKKESPLYFKTDSLGCFSYDTKEDDITFVVQSPYHKTDTIVRFIDSNLNQTVPLATDDYALMLRYYTDGNVKDWNIHKTRLENFIADEALIYQFHSSSIGVEIFSKEDFVSMLTIPTSSLKKIKILNREFKNGKITKLKFIVL